MRAKDCRKALARFRAFLDEVADPAFTWEYSDGSSMGQDARVFLRQVDAGKARIAEMEEINVRRTLNAINRICTDCGDDKCGPEHDHCFACECRALKARIAELEGANAILLAAQQRAEQKYREAEERIAELEGARRTQMIPCPTCEGTRHAGIGAGCQTCHSTGQVYTAGELLGIIVANAVAETDTAMNGATDCYHVPLDDIDAAREWLQANAGITGRKERSG